MWTIRELLTAKMELESALKEAEEMQRRVPVLVLFSVALGSLCLYLIYSVVDQSVSLDHARAAQRSLEEDRAVLGKLTLDLAKAAKRDEVEAVLSSKYAQGHIVKREADAIFVDSVGLRFRDDVLVGILFMNEAATRH